jgi:4a-hydroxytetrahydrobiopterin dehydratase
MDMLAQLHCAPLHLQVGEAGQVSGKQLLQLHREVPHWHLFKCDGCTRLQRIFTFATFSEALSFADGIGRLAQAEGHFPTILIEWGRVEVRWWTPAIKGVYKNDFIMAAKTDHLYLAATSGSVSIPSHSAPVSSGS